MFPIPTSAELLLPTSGNDTGKKSNQGVYCRKCREHGLIRKTKGHYSECLYRTCYCEKCEAVKLLRARNLFNNKQRKLLDQEISPKTGQQDGVNSSTHLRSKGKNKLEVWSKRPTCRKCEGHRKTFFLKGHVVCPFDDCFCSECRSVMFVTSKRTNQRRSPVQNIYVPKPIQTWQPSTSLWNHSNPSPNLTNLAVMLELKQLIASNPSFHHLAPTHSLNTINKFFAPSQSAYTNLLP